MALVYHGTADARLPDVEFAVWGIAMARVLAPVVVLISMGLAGSSLAEDIYGGLPQANALVDNAGGAVLGVFKSAGDIQSPWMQSRDLLLPSPIPVQGPTARTPAGVTVPAGQLPETAHVDVTGPRAAEYQALSDLVTDPRNFVQLRPATSTPAPTQPARTPVVAQPSTFIGGAQARPNPGGISLSRAAAMRMALNMDIEALHYSDGRLVVSGAPATSGELDAALFLTALRAACEPDDPSFSLDSDNGRAWLEQGDEAAAALWKRIEPSFSWDRRYAANRGRNRQIENGFDIRAVSARRDYPEVWAELAPKYPDLRARLVFRPTWLKDTRFGEVLYKADVLLKELSGGVPALDSSDLLRAASIDRYISADARRAAGNLLSNYDGDKVAEARLGETGGYRLWFDLIPDEHRQPACRMVGNSVRCKEIEPLPADLLAAVNNPPPKSKLRSLLYARGYLGGSPAQPSPIAVYSHENAVDVTRVYPRMFVRRHDLAAGKDVEGASPALDAVANDVNSRTELYVAAYPEMRALTQIFRAYVAAVKMGKQDPQLCRDIRRLPLLAAEKTSTPLPEHHPSELFVTVARYVSSTRRQRKMLFGLAVTINGGIALRGKAALSSRESTLRTPVTQSLVKDIREKRDVPLWKSDTGKQAVAFWLDPSEHAPELVEMRHPTLSLPEDVLEAQAASDEKDRQAKEDAHRKLAEAQNARDDAERLEREQQRKNETVARLALLKEARDHAAARYGTPVEGQSLLAILPFAAMARDACTPTTASDQRIDWESLLTKAGHGTGYRALLKNSGFCAVLYTAPGNKLTIAYAQRERAGSLGVVDLHLKAAVDLVWAVRSAYPGASLSLTGKGEGAALAAYAGEQTGLSQVITFNLNESPSFVRGAAPGRVDITVVKFDVGDG